MLVRWFILCFLLVCIGCNTLPPEHLRTFLDAQSAFDAGDYSLSITLYQRLLDEGVRAGAVYYNLGNAYARADEPAFAIVAYYLAKQYIPADPHLNTNLRAVLASHGGSPPPSNSSLADSLFFWQNMVGYNTKIWASLALTIATFLGGLCYLCKQSKWLKRCLVGSVILTTVAFASVGVDWYRFEGIERVIVIGHAVPRKGNSEQYEPAFAPSIPFGTLAVILDERSGWFFLRFPGGQEGWLPQFQTVKVQL